MVWVGHKMVEEKNRKAGVDEDWIKWTAHEDAKLTKQGTI